LNILLPNEVEFPKTDFNELSSLGNNGELLRTVGVTESGFMRP